MDDRELLKLAAKAAGMLWIDDCPKAQGGLTIQRQECTGIYNFHWNPLTDDGDALWLAAKLYLHRAIAEAHRLISDETDIYAATRRAIVLAAAEIGKHPL